MRKYVDHRIHGWGEFRFQYDVSTTNREHVTIEELKKLTKWKFLLRTDGSGRFQDAQMVKKFGDWTKTLTFILQKLEKKLTNKFFA